MRRPSYLDDWIRRSHRAQDQAAIALSNLCDQHEATIGDLSEQLSQARGDLSRLRDGMRELGFIVGRNPDGEDETVDATLLVVREHQARLKGLRFLDHDALIAALHEYRKCSEDQARGIITAYLAALRNQR